METTVNLQIILAFCLYLGCMMAIGVYYSNKQKNLSQYILGDRKLGPWLTSMSAEASDMSGWMLMGLPGYAYLNGQKKRRKRKNKERKEKKEEK